MRNALVWKVVKYRDARKFLMQTPACLLHKLSSSVMCVHCIHPLLCMTWDAPLCCSVTPYAFHHFVYVGILMWRVSRKATINDWNHTVVMFVQPTASSHWKVGIALIYDTTTIAYAPSVHVSIACMLIVTMEQFWSPFFLGLHAWINIIFSTKMWKLKLREWIENGY